jgi:hypothetical protein
MLDLENVRCFENTYQSIVHAGGSLLVLNLKKNKNLHKTTLEAILAANPNLQRVQVSESDVLLPAVIQSLKQLYPSLTVDDDL